MTYSSSSVEESTFWTRLVSRLSTFVYAEDAPHRLRVGLIGGDIPMFPPLALLLSILLAFLLWKLSKRRCRFVPTPIQSLTIRILFLAVGVGMGLSLASACRRELERVGTGPNFQSVSKIATGGPFAWTRNGMYIAVLLIQASLAIAFDTAWLGVSLLSMILYLDRIVVPAEERFLTRELGAEYQAYCDTVPRWLVSFGN